MFPLANVDREIEQVGYEAFVRSLFADMFPSDKPSWMDGLVKLALEVDWSFGSKLLNNIAHWDDTRLAHALTEFDASLLAIQSTTLDRQGRPSMKSGEVSPYQRFVARHAAKTTLFTVANTHHFCHVSRPAAINDAISCFLGTDALQLCQMAQGSLPSNRM